MRRKKSLRDMVRHGRDVTMHAIRAAIAVSGRY